MSDIENPICRDILPNESDFRQLQTSVVYTTPELGRQMIRDITGEDQELDYAKTVFFDKNHGESLIIIDNQLEGDIQSVLLVHEIEQLRIIKNWVSSGRPIQEVLPYAHFVGLEAGISFADTLGIKDKYLVLRANWDEENRKKFKKI